MCENYHRNLQIPNFSYEFPYSIRNMLYEIFSFMRKCLHFLLNYPIILLVWLSLYVRLFQKNLQFYQMSYIILNFIKYILEENFQFYHKMSPLLFQMYSNYICMAIIVFEVFFLKNLQFYTL